MVARESADCTNTILVAPVMRSCIFSLATNSTELPMAVWLSGFAFIVVKAPFIIMFMVFSEIFMTYFTDTGILFAMLAHIVTNCAHSISGAPVVKIHIPDFRAKAALLPVPAFVIFVPCVKLVDMLSQIQTALLANAKFMFRITDITADSANAILVAPVMRYRLAIYRIAVFTNMPVAKVAGFILRTEVMNLTSQKFPT